MVDEVEVIAGVIGAASAEDVGTADFAIGAVVDGSNSGLESEPPAHAEATNRATRSAPTRLTS